MIIEDDKLKSWMDASDIQITRKIDDQTIFFIQGQKKKHFFY